MVKEPKISIVTPSYNQGHFLEETICSIIDQKYPNLEYIVIDGGSTDNSVDIIKKYSKHITYWVSEPDRGQSHAINKGLSVCSGVLFNWINSDDLLEPNALHRIAKLYTENPESLWFIGNLRVINGNNQSVANNINIEKFLKGSYRNLPVRQQSNFLKTQWLRDVGGVNEKLNYTMDAELLFKLIIQNEFKKIASTKDILGVYRVQPDSKGSTKIWDFVDELYMMYFKIAKRVNNNKAEFFFESMIKNVTKKTLYDINTYTFNKECAIKLLNYQIGNWIDYYYCNKEYEVLRKFFKILDLNKLILSDRIYYAKIQLKSLFI